MCLFGREERDIFCDEKQVEIGWLKLQLMQLILKKAFSIRSITNECLKEVHMFLIYCLKVLVLCNLCTNKENFLYKYNL